MAKPRRSPRQAAALNCFRCRGLLVDNLDSPSLGLHLWRCVNCGDVIDRVILQHRAWTNPEWELRLASLHR